MLSRLEARDVDSLFPMMYDSFDKFDSVNFFFGRRSRASYAHGKRELLEGLQHDPYDVTLKIEDLDAPQVDVNLLDDKGNTVATEKRPRIVCMSNWKVYPTYVPTKEKGKEQPRKETGQTGRADGEETATESEKAATKLKEFAAGLNYLETEEERLDAATLLDDFMSRRRRSCQEAHVLCFLLFTDPEYQGKGCGKMMMQWGSDLADALMLPCWIEASLEGEGLYKKFGYVEREKVRKVTKNFVSEYSHMRRPAMVETMTLEGKTMVRGWKAGEEDGHRLLELR